MSTTDQRLAAFRAELLALLLKHHAVIEVAYEHSGDVGTWDEHMNVCFTDIKATRQIADSWGIEPYDLKERA